MLGGLTFLVLLTAGRRWCAVGSSVHLGLALLNTAAFVLCVLFLSYVITVLRPFLRHREVELGDRADFDWHVLIPA